MTREYTPRETRWVTEYVLAHWASAELAGYVSYQVPLGPLAQGATQRAAPRADCIIYLAHKVVIIEADTENITSALGQLLYYDYLFPLTPGNVDRNKPRDLTLLLLDMPDTYFRAFSTKYNIDIDTWAPPWLLEYVRERGQKRGTI